MRKNLPLYLLLSIAAFSTSAVSPHFPRFTHQSPITNHQSPDSSYILNDSIKYQGYRLDLTTFEVLKKTEEWWKIRCTIVNSGRKDVDFSKEGTEYWVQINFDQSLFEGKLGGFRENIRYELVRQKFKLVVGKMEHGFEMKVPTLLPSGQKPRQESEPPVSLKESPVSEVDSTVSAKGGDELSAPDEEALVNKKEACPDVLFTNLKIVAQDDKWATLEYTIANQGKGVFHVYGNAKGREQNLVVKAFISGVTTLSRGALPIGGQFIEAAPDHPQQLQPGEQFSGKIRLDVRKKTRYMKSLILSLDSNQFSVECNKANNTGAVVLD